MSICIIPARGGSKRIPKKNIKLFHGKPLIAWSITAALESSVFTDVIVSTDNQEIADVALQIGASVPFLRPASLSDDYSGTKDVISHCIKSGLRSDAPEETLVCCLYPTAPFVTPGLIEQAKDLFLKNTAASMSFIAARYSSPIQRSFTINDQGFTKMLDPSMLLVRSQDLPSCYYDAGQLYWSSIKNWTSNSNLLQNAVALIQRSWLVQDIDTIEDWQNAEILFKLLQTEHYA